MSLRQVFTDTIAKLTTIQIPNPVTKVSISKNYAKTPSNQNQLFKYINIWDEQIDDMIKGRSYSLALPAIFVEYKPGDCKMLLNNVSSYPESIMTLHIFSIVLDGQEDSMEQNLDIYDKRDKVKSKIAGWSPFGCSTLMCCLDKLDYKHKNISKYLLSYNFNFQDQKGSIFDTDSEIYENISNVSNPTVTNTQTGL